MSSYNPENTLPPPRPAGDYGQSFQPPPSPPLPGEHGQPGDYGTPGGYRPADYGQAQARYQFQAVPSQQVQPYQQQQYPVQQFQVAPKSPAVGVLCSVFIPGLGSMISGNAGIGTLILCLYILGVVLSVFLIGIPIAIGMWIWGLVNAHSSAVRWNRQHGIIS